METEKDAKKITREYRMGQWAEIMQERVRSGLSIVKYCEREGMPTNRYHYWQRRLWSAAAQEMIASPVERVTPVPAGWTQVTATEEASSPSGAKKTGVSIEIGKCRVSVEKTSDKELLGKVCKTLVSLC